MTKPRRFYNGKQALQFYIPGYGTENEPTHRDDDVERFANEAMKKLDLPLIRTKEPAQSSEAQKQVNE